MTDSLLAVAANVTISWEEKYYIAATKDTFMNGGMSRIHRSLR